MHTTDCPNLRTLKGPSVSDERSAEEEVCVMGCDTLAYARRALPDL